MKEQTVGQLCVRGDGESCPGSAHVGGQRSHDGVVASEAVAVIVIVDYCDFDSHAVEVDHAVNHVGGLSCCDAWEKQSKSRSTLKKVFTLITSSKCGFYKYIFRHILIHVQIPVSRWDI